MKDLSPYLNQDQLRVVAKCKYTSKCGWIMDTGFGKSRTGVAVAFSSTKERPNVLWVCPKTLIANYLDEIKLAYQNKIRCYVYHTDYNKDIKSISNIDEIDADIIITSPEVIMKYYTKDKIENFLIRKRIINEGRFQQHEIKDYIVREEPYPGTSFLYSTPWDYVFVDEFNEYCNITAERTLGIIALPGKNRYPISASLFAETKIESLLSYYLFIQDEHFPINIPDGSKYLRDINYPGLNVTVIAGQAPKLNVKVFKKDIIVHLSEPEEKIYTVIRSFILQINKRVKMCKKNSDVPGVRKFNAQLLAMLTTLRECLVCPLIPLTKMALGLFDFNNFDELGEVFDEYIRNLDIDDYLDDPNSIISSRLQACLDIIKKHKKIVIFTVYRSTITLLLDIINRKYNRYATTFDGNTSAKNRGKIIDRCKNSDDFILVLTYKIGASGLNMQEADTVIFIDYEWNETKTNQARDRVLRQGQIQNVNIYYLYSNCGVEDAVLKKQIEKVCDRNELMVGPSKGNITTIKINEIVTILEAEVTGRKISNLYIDEDY